LTNPKIITKFIKIVLIQPRVPMVVW